jgi:ferredoxin
MNTMKVIVDEETCIGCGACESVCPDVFYMEDEKAKVKEGVDFAAFKEAIDEAVSSCPVECITIQ